jgi:hypothetical protein
MLPSPPPNNLLDVNPPWGPWTISTQPIIPWGNVQTSHAW